MAGDRLSELPDDLLRRILRFVPLREAASTTALSRRWRAPLWRSSGAVNLETGNTQRYYDNPRFFTRRDDFVSAAVRELDAADVPVTRLTLRLESDLHDVMTSTVHQVVARYTNLVDVALYHRGARRVEELCIVAKDTRYCFSEKGLYTLTLNNSLQLLETLRVLELTRCNGLVVFRHLALPRLSSLVLSSARYLACTSKSHFRCDQHLSSLQRVIDAAPALTAIHLHSVLIDATDKDEATTTCCRLRCPAAAVLVLDSCSWEQENPSRNNVFFDYKKTIHVHAVEIHAQRLRRFRYKGPLISFSFTQQPPELEQVDLDFSGQKNRDPKPDHDLAASFWPFTRSFTSTTKQMRLRVNSLDDIALLSEARRVELLPPAFRRLVRLEVQGADLTKGKAAAMAILNLLRCCPVLSALRIILTAEQADASSSSKKVVPNNTRIAQKEIQIAALAQCHSFRCLKRSLRRVDLQFQLEKSNCLGVKLIKFFAENAMVLEEMYIDGGDDKLCDHMNPKTKKWNSKRRKSGATCFVVLPLNKR